MKDYKADENLNYADLNNWDIGTPTGYGPVFKEGGDYRSSGRAVGPKRVTCRAEGCNSWWFEGNGSLNEQQHRSWGYCYAHRRKAEEQSEQAKETLKWVGKTTLSLGASWFLGPEIAIKVGGLTWGTTKIVENVVEDENLKEVLHFIGDIGFDTAKGGFIGKLIGAGSGTLASKTTQEIGHCAAKAIAVNGGKIAGDIRELIEIGRIISLCQKGYELKEKYEKYGGKAFCELARHEYHKKEQGRNYDSNCEICNP